MQDEETPAHALAGVPRESLVLVCPRSRPKGVSKEDGRRKRLSSALAPLAALLLLGTAALSRGDGPLSAKDVERFLKAGISESMILAELHTRGYGEAFDWKAEQALRAAGASETLVVAIRREAPATDAPAVAPRPAPRPEPPPAQGPAEPTFGVKAREVRVPVSVLDANGQPVVGLDQADFQISEDGKKQKVTLFSAERRPLRVALALDVSGSMDNKILQVEEALKHFIDLLEPQDEVLVMTFNQDVRIAQDFTSDRELLGHVLDTLDAGGGTALYDAAAEAIRRVSKGPAEAKAVVLVTDGVDTKSLLPFDSLREQARRAEVPVYSIGLDREIQHPGSFRPQGRFGSPGGGGGGGGFGGGRGGMGGHGGGGRGGPRKGFDAHPLTDLAEDTGGTAQILKGPEHYTPDSDTPGSGRLKTAVESIAMALRHRYLLGYEPAEGKPGWHTLLVELTRPSLVARTRKGYYTAG